MAILIISILMISMGASMILTPTANAHTPPWTIVSYAYLVASPNPVGVGQATAIVMWIDTPMVGATVTNDIRRHDYTLTITKPDGNIETKHWDVVTDSTSVQYFQYTPIKLATTHSNSIILIKTTLGLQHSWSKHSLHR